MDTSKRPTTTTVVRNKMFQHNYSIERISEGDKMVRITLCNANTTEGSMYEHTVLMGVNLGVGPVFLVQNYIGFSALFVINSRKL